MTTCNKHTHVYGEGPCLRAEHHRGICCATRAVAADLDAHANKPTNTFGVACAICPRFESCVCPLCECGLTPMRGLNEEFVFELALALGRGASDLGQKPSESIM